MLARQLARTSKLTRPTRRLARELPRLMEEFGASRDHEEVLDCADAVLHYYEGRGVVPPWRSLVQRRTRECLQVGICEGLTAP